MIVKRRSITHAYIILMSGFIIDSRDGIWTDTIIRTLERNKDGKLPKKLYTFLQRDPKHYIKDIRVAYSYSLEEPNKVYPWFQCHDDIRIDHQMISTIKYED